MGEHIVYQSSWRPSVRACIHTSVCVFTHSNMGISETNGSIATKFYLNHHWVWGKAALGFGPDRIRTLVPMATESSHRVIMEKTVFPLFSAVFHPILFILASNDDMHESSDEFEFRPARTLTAELAALELLKKIPIG